jgi:hypothetical protein
MQKRQFGRSAKKAITSAHRSLRGTGTVPLPPFACTWKTRCAGSIQTETTSRFIGQLLAVNLQRPRHNAAPLVRGPSTPSHQNQLKDVCASQPLSEALTALYPRYWRTARLGQPVVNRRFRPTIASPASACLGSHPCHPQHVNNSIF